MSEKETGGPAFPTDDVCYNGMTLRDYLAAKAMGGLCTAFATTSTDWPASDEQEDYDVVALHAYAIADAMLKARNQ